MTDSNIKKIPHYTESVFYELKQMARLMKMHGLQMFASLEIELSAEEYCALDTIMCNPGLCQRDLAKLLLFDRANTGRILNKLENKNLISRSADTKNNRLIKKVQITDNGIKELENINSKIIVEYSKISGKIPPKKFEEVKQSIRDLRISFEKNIEMKI